MGAFDCTCQECGHQYGWFGKMTDKPKCPECGHKPDHEALKKLEAEIEKIVAEDNKMTCPLRERYGGFIGEEKGKDSYKETAAGFYECSFCGSISFSCFEVLCHEATVADSNVMVFRVPTTPNQLDTIYIIKTSGTEVKFNMTHWPSSKIIGRQAGDKLAKALVISALKADGIPKNGEKKAGIAVNYRRCPDCGSSLITDLSGQYWCSMAGCSWTGCLKDLSKAPFGCNLCFVKPRCPRFREEGAEKCH